MQRVPAPIRGVAGVSERMKYVGDQRLWFQVTVQMRTSTKNRYYDSTERRFVVDAANAYDALDKFRADPAAIPPQGAVVTGVQVEAT